MAAANGVRLRTRIRMSPARMRAVLGRQHLADSSQPSMVWAMRPASRTTGGARSSPRAATRARSARPARASRSARSRSARRRPDAMGDMRDRLGDAVDARACAPARRRCVDRRQQRLDGAKRQVQRHAAQRQPRQPGAGANASPIRRTWWAPRPGSCRSTASRRRRRTACASSRAPRRRRRTPRPARGSPPTAPGSCPAPRRPGCGRGRRRACRAPTRRPRRRRAGSPSLPTRSSKSSAARRALASP